MSDHKNEISKAISSLKHGEPCIFPTDTVYGVGVSVEGASSPRVLYDIKGRDNGKPIAWLVGSVYDLQRYGDHVPFFALELARRFWPGALTIIVAASDTVPRAFVSQFGTIGMRMPDNQTALSIIRSVGCPIATTSANISGNPAVSKFDSLDPRLLHRVDIAVSDVLEDAESGVASTVIDCTGEHPRIVRLGDITAEDIAKLA